MVWSLLAILAFGYAALVATLFFLQPRFVYYPGVGRGLWLTPDQAGLSYQSVEITTADGVKLQGWYVPAPVPRAAVLLFHGNAGNISHRVDYLRMFRDLGYSTLIVDYRGYGRSAGSPSEQGTYLDAEAAWRHLVRERRTRPQDIVLFGESLGGAVAAWLAAQERPRALVLACAFTSVPDLAAEIYPFLPVRLLSRFRYDTRAYLGKVGCPVLIAHSRDDEIVPFGHAHRLLEAATEPKRLLEMEGGHNEGFFFKRDEWVRALDDFLTRSASGGQASW